MKFEDGTSYSFAPYEAPPAAATVTVNTEGLGQVACAPEGMDIEFDDEYPMQSIYVNIPSLGKYTISAKADEGWKFVKWTMNGEDFSTESTITVDITENTDFIAVFGE